MGALQVRREWFLLGREKGKKQKPQKENLRELARRSREDEFERSIKRGLLLLLDHGKMEIW